jgi:hypothetical protein
MLGELTDEAIETLLAQHAAGRAPRQVVDPP